ncbi:hypothetical protein [Mesorhizobium sp. STM 4661]|nr:hypothetical protein [Mesorhizobium sp. STM 4661]
MPGLRTGGGPLDLAAIIVAFSRRDGADTTPGHLLEGRLKRNYINS